MRTTGRHRASGSAGRARHREPRADHRVSEFDSELAEAAFADCPPGTVVIGTGFSLRVEAGGAFEDLVVSSAESINDTQVRVSAREAEPVPFDWTVVAQAICARVSP